MKFKPNYIVIPLITLGIACTGNYFTQLGMDWYDMELIHPEFTPPDYVFGIAWTIIFAMAAVSAIIIWNCKHRNPYIIPLFILNAILNVSWSLVFFTLHQIELAFLALALLAASLLGLFSLTYVCCRNAAMLLLPYILWTCFAAYLSYGFFLLN